MFGFRRLETTIVKALFSYLVYTSRVLRSRYPSGWGGRGGRGGGGGGGASSKSLIKFFSL
jgi:hypothetical protein